MSTKKDKLVGLKEGLSALSEACDKWENFGIQIELPYSYLSKIRGEFSRNDDRMRELLNERLKKGDLTWKTVVKALRDKSVGKEDLAEKIEKEHLKPPRGKKNPIPPSGGASKEGGGRKRPPSGEDGGGGDSKRPRKAEYYDESMFVNQATLSKYRCMHCNKVAKKSYRCKCAWESDKGATEGKAKAKDRGLSCGDCTNQPCKSCGGNDYKEDGGTDANIRKLKIYCSNRDKGCDKKVTMAELSTHLKTCSVPCKYKWAGCTKVAAGKELEDHEEDVKEHFGLTIGTIKEKLDEMSQRIDSLEATVRSQASSHTPPTST